MADPSFITKQKILDSAKKEFLEKGFVNASLRTIASNAGLTTGAMYRHFKDKDALFCALVDEAIEVSTKAVMAADVPSHIKASSPLSEEHRQEEVKILYNLLDYIYDNFDAFTLLISKASGSTHEHFVDEMCNLYTKNCLETMNWMYENKISQCPVDELTAHVICSCLISAFTEFISHKVPKEKAVSFITTMREFFHVGTCHIMGIHEENTKA